MDSASIEDARFAWITQHHANDAATRIPYLPQLDDLVVFLPALYEAFLQQCGAGVDANLQTLPSQVTQHNAQYVVQGVAETGLAVCVTLRTMSAAGAVTTFQIAYHPFHAQPEFLVRWSRARGSLVSLHKLLAQSPAHRSTVTVWYAEEGADNPMRGTAWPARVLAWHGDGKPQFTADTVLVRYATGETALVSPWEINYPSDATLRVPAPERASSSLDVAASYLNLNLDALHAALVRATDRFCFGLLDACAFADVVRLRIANRWYRSYRAQRCDEYLLSSAAARVTGENNAEVAAADAVVASST